MSEGGINRRAGRSPSLGRQLAITGIMVVVILLIGEGSLRVWAYFFRLSYQRYDLHEGFVRLVPNYDGTVYGKRVKINANGFRGREFVAEKPEGIYRIFNIGDSVTFGLAGDDCYYSIKLERLLNKGGSGKRFEVINAGVEGYNSRDALNLLEHDVFRYQPDLITVLIGWNDLMKHDPGKPESSEAVQRLAYATYDIYLVKFWRKVVYSYLRPAVMSVQKEDIGTEREAYQKYVPLVFEENLRKIIQAAKAHEVRVVLLTLPSALHPQMSGSEISKLQFPYYTYSLAKLRAVHARYNESIRKVGASEGVPVLDLEPVFRGKERLFFDTVHTECEGHDVFAAELAAFLRGLRIGTETSVVGGPSS